VDGVDGHGDKQPTCLEQSCYLMELVAAAKTVKKKEEKLNL